MDLTGKLLIAMPGIGDPRFDKTVIYLCAHSEDGAMGLVVNREFDDLTFPDLLEQLNIEPAPHLAPIMVQFGGPVESGRGFVLHTQDYMHDGSLAVDDTIALTATVDILRAIAEGDGPEQRLLALGYAGWGPGQLEGEVRRGDWLIIDVDPEIIFGPNPAAKWRRAIDRGDGFI